MEIAGISLTHYGNRLDVKIEMRVDQGDMLAILAALGVKPVLKETEDAEAKKPARRSKAKP